MAVSQDHDPSVTAVTSGQPHTAGPWTFAGAKSQLIVAPHPDLGTIGVAKLVVSCNQADGALIAAAPDLLEALKELHLKTVIGTDDERHAALNRAWAAITKAQRYEARTAEAV